MPEYVKKGLMNHYPKVPGGYSDPDWECVILTRDEYNALKNKVRNAENEARIAEANSEVTVKKMKRESDSHIQAAKETARKSIEATELELAEAQAEADFQKKLNANLIRICKERANADRKLKPKKEHTGYKIRNSQQKNYVYRQGKASHKASVWETILQTPYVIDFDAQEAKNLIYSEIMDIVNKIGITAFKKDKYYQILDKDVQLEENIMFDIRLSRNFTFKYWEITFCHTFALGSIPKDMAG